MAPEMEMNMEYDIKVDIFSAAVCLFIMVTGQPPFERASTNDQMQTLVAH